MPVSIEEARHAAQLARLALGAEELESLAKDLSTVLEHFESVAELASADAEVSDGSTRERAVDHAAVLRPDTVGTMLTSDEALRNAPASEDGQFAVPGFLPDEP